VLRRLIHDGGRTSSWRIKKEIPELNSPESADWRKFVTKDYPAVFWSYNLNYTPYLFCNGIMVCGGYQVANGSRRIMPKLVYADILRTPSVAVYDPDGKLPLNLQRTSLSLHSTDLTHELTTQVVDDLIAYAVVTGITDLRLPIKDWRWLQGQYRGFAYEEPYRDINYCHKWFVTRTGFGLSNKYLLGATGLNTIIFAYTTSQISEANTRGTLDGTRFLEKGACLLFCGRSSESQVIFRRTVLTETLSLPKTVGATPPRLSGFTCSGKRLLVKKSFYSSVLDRPSTSASFKFRLQTLKAEWEDENWLLITVGKISETPALNLSDDLLAWLDYANAEAVVENYEVAGGGENDILSQRWLEAIGGPTIPYDHSDRAKIKAAPRVAENFRFWESTP
jgi:hypothetical protein